ncbi:Ig-like domain-containing protein [Pseudomonas sp. FH4]|uniref:Ig-like domain-containing protein n=1 Tax=Pseudomonas sp. FH4 TaxID=1284393 RepID=UPI0003F85198|nr:Ig-like domain-containing protein [Pseudomonas sp. FH4]
MPTKKRIIETATVNSDISQLQDAASMTPGVTPTLSEDSVTSSTDITSTPAITRVFDNVGESVGLRGSSSSTDDTRPTFQGIAEPNSLVTVRDNGVLLGTAQVNASGEWSFTPAIDLSPGDYNLRVSDSFGQSEVFVLRILGPGEAAPEVGITYYFDDTGVQQGYFPNNTSTDDARPTFGGVAQPKAIVTIYEGDQVIGSAQADAKGKWQFTPTNDLSVGAHSFTVIDASGQHSDVFNVQIQDPTQAPDPTPRISWAVDNVGSSQGNLGNGASTDDNFPVLSGHGKPNSVLNVYANGTYQGVANVDASGNWSFSFSQPLLEGNQILTVEDITDGLVSADFNLHIESLPALPQPPNIESVFDNVGYSQGSLASGASTDDLRPQLLGKGSPNSELHIFDNGIYLNSVKVDNGGNWSLSTFKDLSDGTHSFTVVNAAGQSSQPFELNVIAPPEPSIESVFDNVGYSQGSLASGASTDDLRPQLLGKGSPNSELHIFDNGIYLNSVKVDNGGNWSLSTFKDLSDGTHSFTVVNAAGQSSQPFELNVITPPAPNPSIGSAQDNVGGEQAFLTNGASTDDARPGLYGEGRPNSVITIYDGEQEIGSTISNTGGDWYFSPRTELSLGDHHFVAVDSAGERSETFSLTVEPQAPFISYFIDNVGIETGYFGDGDATDDATPTFTGSGIPDSLITFYSDDQVIGSAQASADGQWRFTPAQPLSEGDHSISAISTNGVISNTFELTVTPLTGLNNPLGLTLCDVMSDTSKDFFVTAAPEVSSGFSVPVLEFDAQLFAQDSTLSPIPSTDYGVTVQADLTMVNLMEQMQLHQPMT